MYSNYVNLLKILQKVGYVIAVIYSFVWGISNFGNIGFVFSPLIAIVLCFSNYIGTQGFIAIVDLLNSIEANTRKTAYRLDRDDY